MRAHSVKILMLTWVILGLSACETLKQGTASGKSATLEKEAAKSVAEQEYARAIEQYQQLLNTDPKRVEYRLGWADSTRLSGDYTQACPGYTVILGMPLNAEQKAAAQEGKGLCLLQEGKLEDAISTFEQVLNLDATRWRSVNGLAVAFALSRRYADADAYYDVALGLSSQNPVILNNRGLSQALAGNLPQATQTLEQALKATSSNDKRRARIALNLAMVYGMQGNMKDAERTAKPHLSEAALYNNLGVYALLGNKKGLAEEYLTQALSANPTLYKKAWSNLQKVK